MTVRVGPNNQTAVRHDRRRRFSRVTKAMLSLVAVCLSLVLAEIIVRLFVPVRNVGPSFTVHDPIYLRSLKKSFHCRRITPEFTMRLTTNSLGHRGPEPAIFPKGAVVFLGDSFTLGYGVTDGDEFPAQVDRRLADRFGADRPQVINAGVGATGNGRWVKFLRAEAAAYEPRYVVLQVTGNDFGDNWRERLFRLAADRTLIELPVRPPGITDTAQRIIESAPLLSDSYLVGLARQILSRGNHHWPSPLPANPADTDHEQAAEPKTTWSPRQLLTFSLIEESLSICQANKWPVLVLIVHLSGRDHDKLIQICDRRDAPVITAPYKHEQPGLYYQIDGHWNRLGHQVVADLVAQHLSTDDRLTSTLR